MARVLVFLKGKNSHDYEFSSAVLEDFYNVSPDWRARYLAASVFSYVVVKGRTIVSCSPHGPRWVSSRQRGRLTAEDAEDRRGKITKNPPHFASPC